MCKDFHSRAASLGVAQRLSLCDNQTGVRTRVGEWGMFAVAVQLGEAVRLALLARGARGSLVLGTSLGGFLALLHHLMLGTADGYVPLLAGPDLAHVMLGTHYRHFLAPQALAQASAL